MLINNDWMTDLPTLEVHYMSEGVYHHCSTVVNQEGWNTSNRRQFCYFNMWNLLPDFKERIQANQRTDNKGTKIYQLVGKLNRMKVVLKRLNKESFSDVEAKAEAAMTSLMECQVKIQKDPRNVALINEEVRLLQESINWKNSNS